MPTGTTRYVFMFGRLFDVKILVVCFFTDTLGIPLTKRWKTYGAIPGKGYINGGGS